MPTLRTSLLTRQMLPTLRQAYPWGKPVTPALLDKPSINRKLLATAELILTNGELQLSELVRVGIDDNKRKGRLDYGTPMKL